MSLFKKPKKTVQQSRRIFTSEIENMVVDDEGDDKADDEMKQKKKDKRASSKPIKSSLLSFDDEGIFARLGLTIR